RKPIVDAVDALGDLAVTTSGFLGEAREPLKKDIAALGELTTLLNDHEEVVEHFIQFMPHKLRTITRTASYGSWFNFYNCKAEVALRLNSEQEEPIMIPLGDHSEDRERC
ncbi:MAG: MCE family protein, partial [Pseudonocardiaceae bacterium]